MTAFGATVLLLAATLPPRIDDQPMRVCLDAPKAIFWVENPNDGPVLASFRVERWSEEGDTPGWAVVQPDLTQKEARPKQVKSVKLEARQRRYVNWELQKRSSPPSLVTGRHRLVLTWSQSDGEPPGTVTHEFILVDCGV
jgi:hypothetical protein